MRAVVLQHEEHEGIEQLGPALQRAGFTLVQRLRTVARGDEDAELVVVMGGAMSVWETAQHPFLAAERELLAARLRRNAPCLGICLGAQLLALAAGAEVCRGTNGLEVGAAPIRCTTAGRADPAFGVGCDELVVAHWHQDTFTPVPGAELLASTARYEQQAFRIGRSYGLQFHVELDAAALVHWLELGRNELAANGCDVAALLRGTPSLQGSQAARSALLDRLAQRLRA